MAILYIVRMTIKTCVIFVLISGQAYIPAQPVYVNSGLGAPTESHDL